jgi:biotin transport system substrate-specific component
MEDSKSNTLKLVFTAIFAAVISVSAFITIPSAVPFTLQTMAIFLTLFIIGGDLGSISIVVYILLGIVGLPVFSGFKGGMGVILGNTGGYIIGFIFMGITHIIISKIVQRADKKMDFKFNLLSGIIGLLICYTFGTIWFYMLYTQNTGPVGIITILSWCVFPFIIPDLIKLVVADLIATQVNKRIKF